MLHVYTPASIAVPKSNLMLKRCHVQIHIPRNVEASPARPIRCQRMSWKISNRKQRCDWTVGWVKRLPIEKEKATKKTQDFQTNVWPWIISCDQLSEDFNLEDGMLSAASLATNMFLSKENVPKRISLGYSCIMNIWIYCSTCTFAFLWRGCLLWKGYFESLFTWICWKFYRFWRVKDAKGLESSTFPRGHCPLQRRPQHPVLELLECVWSHSSWLKRLAQLWMYETIYKLVGSAGYQLVQGFSQKK